MFEQPQYEPNEKMAEYSDNFSVRKISKLERTSYYSFDGQLPEGNYGDLEDEEEVFEEDWEVKKEHGDDKQFDSRKEAEKYLRKQTKIRQEMVKKHKGTEFYGFESDATTNMADSVVFRHDLYKLVILAGINQEGYGYEETKDGKHRITIQATIQDRGLILKQTEYEYDEIPTVEEFYGAVKLFIEDYMVWSRYHNLTDFEIQVVQEIAERKNHRYAKKQEGWLNSAGGDFHEVCHMYDIEETEENLDKVVEKTISHMENCSEEYGLE